MKLSCILISLSLGHAMAQQPLTARQIIALIEQHSGGPWHGTTVDTFKAGDPDTPVTGIATAFTDSFDVLKRAAAMGANLVISHEPSFYNHLDDTTALSNDPVYRTKLAFINENHMVVFRFHDHWHYPVMKPDGIMQGEVAALGWENYHDRTDEMMFHMPKTNLDALASSIQKKLSIRAMRVIGDRRLAVTNVAFLPGAAGAGPQIQALERSDVDVLIVGESREWETVEYARDAMSEHKHKALIILGHVASEEAGMDYCVTWLKQFVHDLQITFVPAGEPFWSPLAQP